MDLMTWMVIIGFVISFFLAFGIGANDVANSFGTSVGSKVLTLKQACILATIFEILGAILIGANVSGTIRKGVIDPNDFAGAEQELMFGYVSALAGCCIWLIIATVLNLPVSGTHSIVGAVIGMAMVSRGYKVIKWGEVGFIVASWFISPLLSGLVSAVLFVIIRRFILRAKSPLSAGLKFLPIIYTITIVINFGSVLNESPKLLRFNLIPWWGKIIFASGVGAIVYLVVWLILAPRMRRDITNTMQAKEDNQLAIDEKNAEMALDKETKSFGTQVDHIALILSASDINDYETKCLINKSDKSSEMVGEQPQPLSIVDQNKDLQKMKKFVRKRNRLDSEPIGGINIQNTVGGTAGGTESDYSGDVNFTLSGYLHTVHSFRNYLQQHHRQHLASVTSSAGSHQHPTPPFRKQLSVDNQSHSQQRQQQVPLLANIFQRQNSQPQQAGALDTSISKDDVFASSGETDQLNQLNGGDLGGKKVGRFFTKPAKVDQNNNGNDALVAAPVSAKGSILDIDQEVEENICELPTKEKNRKNGFFKNLFCDNPDFVDKFANSDPPEAAKLFSFLQILTAIFGSFAHGGNDVSNAIGPLIGLYLIFQDGSISGSSDGTPEWILFYGGVGISVGLWILGRRVIKTIGEDLTKITPSSGFVIEIASATTVLVATLFKIPVSTTHCKVGSVVFTGRIRAKQSVDWSLFRNIIVAWIVTVPVTGGIAAACQAILVAIFVNK